jgi:UDP-2,4-diacetamido-2,4,6-trideoxy-beta-L-altropyranose hydrolase
VKKVLFRSFGDSNFGMGHILRSLSLAQQLKKHHGVDVSFAINETDSLPMLKALEESNIHKLDFKNLQTTQFDYLIYDMPFYDKDFFSAIASIDFENRIGLDYFFYDSNHVNIALNLFNHGNPHSGNFTIKEGIQFAILRENIISKNRAAKNGIPQNILITFGSTDPKNNTCEVLKHLPDEQININIILGPLYRFEEELKNSLEKFKNANIEIYRNVPNIEDYILDNDLIFCGGGTTLLESIYLCRSSIVISQTIEEHNFASSLGKLDLCHVIAKPELNTEKLTSLIKSSLSTNTHLSADLGFGKKIIIEELLGKKNG